MIPEIGHFALVLALLVGIAQASVPMIGAWRNDPRLMGVAKSTALAQFGFVAAAFAALTACYVRSDFSVLTVFENSHSAMPLIYKFTSVWGNHEGSMLLWVLILTLFGALVAAFGRNMPDELQGVRARCAGLDRGRVLFVHPADLEPVPAPGARAVRGPRPQPGAAGHRPRRSSADALPRLCRALHHVLICDGRPDRRPHQRRLGALGAAVDARRLDVPHTRHRHGLVLGLLHAGLGRLVVLGSGRERFPHAVARRQRRCSTPWW